MVSSHRLSHYHVYAFLAGMCSSNQEVYICQNASVFRIHRPYSRINILNYSSLHLRLLLRLVQFSLLLFLILYQSGR